MSEFKVKIGILKLGCIGSAPLLEFLLDERAERQDLDTKVMGTGANMSKKRCEAIAMELTNYKPDIALVVSPNAALPGPSVARQFLSKSKIPTIVISDSPAQKITQELDAAGFGYIIPKAESMIGARREFLDPLEMSLFNADIIKVLAITGVFNLIVETIDSVIGAIRRGEKPILPKLIIDKENAISSSGIRNPYARSKAIAAHEISARVSTLSNAGCFLIKDWETYVAVVAAAHEMMRCAAKLADEVRELEKGGDSVFRKPHGKDGVALFKTRLLEKPTKINERDI